MEVNTRAPPLIISKVIADWLKPFQKLANSDDDNVLIGTRYTIKIYMFLIMLRIMKSYIFYTALS